MERRQYLFARWVMGPRFREDDRFESGGKKYCGNVHAANRFAHPKPAQKTGILAYGDGPRKYKIDAAPHKDNLLIPFSILEYNQRLILSAEYAQEQQKSLSQPAGGEGQVSVHRCT